LALDATACLAYLVGEEANMDRYRVQWQAASGAWELPGCDASEATFETSQEAEEAIAALKADPDWQDATFRVVDLADGHDAHRRETPPSITATCPMCQGEASAARSAAAVLGRKGGKAGKGASKVRGTREHYQRIRTTYQQVPASEIPATIRWDVARRDQGQIVEVAYADYPAGRYEASVGSPYKRITDQSEPIGAPERVLYYRRGKATGASKVRR
jgi:hypothetical protein